MAEPRAAGEEKSTAEQDGVQKSVIKKAAVSCTSSGEDGREAVARRRETARRWGAERRLGHQSSGPCREPERQMKTRPEWTVRRAAVRSP